jgi:DNA/RNA-binding domain of Phe-tRNA-synthetase-like protein
MSIMTHEKAGGLERDDVLVATAEWRSAFPGAAVGALVMTAVRNPERSAALEVRKRELEEELRAYAARIGPEGIGSEHPVRAYADYYKRHGKTYHVKAQWESVAVKGRPISTRAALVETMFMAELSNLVLTAGHDLAELALPVQVDITRVGDRYEMMNGAERALDAGDMMMADGKGIISSVLYGPDRRSRISADTREVLFAVYAPGGVGVEAVRAHLDDIRDNVLLIAPEAQTALLATLAAD